MTRLLPAQIYGKKRCRIGPMIFKENCGRMSGGIKAPPGRKTNHAGVTAKAMTRV
jgi:hypothetical protein